MSSPKVTQTPRPAIADPTTDPRSLQTSVSQLKEAVEILQGQRGKDNLDMVVRWKDLVALGLISPGQVPR